MSTSPENLSQPPVVSKPNRTPCLITAGVAGCLLVCLVVVIGGAGWFYFLGPGKTAPIMQGFLGTPPRKTLDAIQVPPTRAAGQPPAAAPAGGMATFTGANAPFTIRYPNDWDMFDDEEDSQTIVFTSPDASADVCIYYTKATAKSADAEFTRLMDELLINDGNVKVLSKKTNADGSLTAEIEFDNLDLGDRVRSNVRVVKTKDNFYLVLFSALPDVFEKTRNTGNTIINSFTAK